MIKFKRFTNSDWMGYQGAESLADGSAPFCGIIEIVMPNKKLKGDVIVTDYGIEIYAWLIEGSIEDEVRDYWVKLHKQESSAAVLLRLHSKMSHEELINLGFSTEVN